MTQTQASQPQPVSDQSPQASTSIERKTFTDYLRKWFIGVFLPIAIFLQRLGVKPNTVTLAGVLGHFAAAYLVATGNITWGGIVLLLMAPVDFLDGTLARLRGESSRFGAFADSVSDRYSEFIILGGLLIYYLREQNWLGCSLVYLAAAGSVLVPYIRAKAEALGYDSKIGLLSRAERYIVLVPGLIFYIPIVAVGIIAILANFTALQRIFWVRKQFYNEQKKSQEESQ